MKSRLARHVLVYALLGLGAVWLVGTALNSGPQPTELRFDEFIRNVDGGRVATAKILERDQRITGELASGDDYRVTFAGEANDLQLRLVEQDVDVSVDPQSPSPFTSLLTNFLPLLLIFGFIFFLLHQSQGGGSRLMSFGRSKAKQVTKETPKTSFTDVAGLDEAVEEIGEIKEYLKDPKRFREMGAKIPKGVLLFGPPGTGKTLLARAVAGEAGVPFFSISGSDFVEMFVGVGASRVRDLFEKAKEAAPAIIFIDEIDAVGRQRGAGLGGGHDEREQTLNQMLVEMDGFDVNTGVVLIAATNRPDILDPALLRPGRFDRHIVIDRPDLVGRTEILRVHLADKRVEDDVSVEVLARRTPGFTGADLANVVNEAALLAARRKKERLTDAELEEAIDRVVAGPERRSRLITESEKQVIAYHEAGHALVSHLMPNAHPVHKISIIPRGRALGYTLTLPTEDRYLVTKGELTDELAVMLGGRAAEELVFSDVTTGAQDDIDRVTKIARQMVCEYGMSSLGPMSLGSKQDQVFLGRDITGSADHSDAVAAEIDEAVRDLIEDAFDQATDVLDENRGLLDTLAERLIAEETLEAAQIEEIFSGVPAPTAERAQKREEAGEEAPSRRSRRSAAKGGRGKPRPGLSPA